MKPSKTGAPSSSKTPVSRLESLKEALVRQDKPSDKVLRAFDALMRKEPGPPPEKKNGK